MAEKWQKKSNYGGNLFVDSAFSNLNMFQAVVGYVPAFDHFLNYHISHTTNGLPVYASGPFYYAYLAIATPPKIAATTCQAVILFFKAFSALSRAFSFASISARVSFKYFCAASIELDAVVDCSCSVVNCCRSLCVSAFCICKFVSNSLVSFCDAVSACLSICSSVFDCSSSFCVVCNAAVDSVNACRAVVNASADFCKAVSCFLLFSCSVVQSLLGHGHYLLFLCWGC